MKLHLGCGQRYLPGYVNVDFPVSSHTVQETTVADVEADILTLRSPQGSIEEIRLHHVFEHFPRPIACGLLASWFSWLRVGGVLFIEVPDFSRTALAVLNPFSTDRGRMVAMRHLFGSHEAPWAVHCEGYTCRGLSALLQRFGFDVVERRRNHWKGTWNFEITSRKTGRALTKKEFSQLAVDYLGRFQVDRSESEERMLSAWMDMFRRQLEASWGS